MSKMAPSRGASHIEPLQNDGEIAVQQQSNSALAKARRNLNYLVSPTSPGAEKPARFRTRALLRTFRYVGLFIIWRLVRWAKYVAVGSLVAAIGATAIGGAVSGVAWLAAPPTFGASIIAASVWSVGKFAAGRLHKRWETDGGEVGEAMRERAEDSHGIKSDGSYGVDMGPRAAPW